MIFLILAIAATVTILYHAAIAVVCAVFSHESPSWGSLGIPMFAMPAFHLAAIWILYAHTV